MNDTLIKLMNYKGAVAANWRVPQTRRQIVANAKKLIKFYYRCKEAHFLTPEVLASLQAYAGALQDLAFIMVQALVKYPELTAVLEEIKTEKPSDLTHELVEEKMRQKETAFCSVCRVPLVYPAYIVWRKDAEIVKRSSPIGIMCLNSRVKKLNDLTIAVKVMIDQRKTVLA
jgi:hypothetical protein